MLSCETELRLAWLSITIVAVLLVVLTAVSWVMWVYGEARPLMWVPVAILEWSFTGAMVSILFETASRKRIHRVGLELYIWIIAKPILGLLLGSLVFFTGLAGATLLGVSPLGMSFSNGRNSWEAALWLNSVAFLVGCTDSLSVSRISHYVRRKPIAVASRENAKEYQRRPLRRPVRRVQRLLYSPPESIQLAERQVKQHVTSAQG